MARFTASSSERLGRVGAGVTRVYLDYASFSPVDPRVVALMRPFLEGGVGNPGAPHSLGLEARASLDGARAKVARLVGATAAGVIFTASATEANNLAIRGLAARARGRHVVTTAIEHISVLNACRYLAKRGWEVAYLPVDGEGRVDPDAVARALRDDTALVSVMAANGEIGTVEPLREIGRAARARRVPFHVDAVGAAGRRLSARRARFLESVLERVPRARLTGARGAARLPHHASIVVEGVKADGVLLELDLRGVAASSGSACNMASGQPSHVLRAIGCAREELEGSLCFTLGRWTTAAEVDAVLEALPAVVERLRRLAS